MKFAIAAFAAACLLAVSPVQAEGAKKIAFVDTGNTGRSVTMEALANAVIQARKLNVLVISRAFDLDPFETAPEANAAALLMKRGIDVSAHRAMQLSAQDVKHADLILTATAKHKAGVIAGYPDAAPKVFTISEYVTGTNSDVVDAYGKPMAVYETVLTQIDGYIAPALEKATK